MEYLRMELYTPCQFAFHVVSRVPDIVCAGYDTEVFRQLRDGIAMRHPYLRTGFDAFKQRVVCIDAGQVGTAIFAGISRLYFTSGGVSDVLCAITDSQYRVFTPDFREVGLKCVLVVHRVGASRKNDSLHIRGVMRELVVRDNLAIHIQLANSPTDKLRGLRTKVKNDESFVHAIILFNYDLCLQR